MAPPKVSHGEFESSILQLLKEGVRTVPANRSRTLRWRDGLQQIAERGGAIELSIAPPQQPEAAGPTEGAVSDLVWRVRLLAMDEHGLTVEPPAAAGLSLSIDLGVDLVGAMTIGQNRWMFHTSVIGTERIDGRQQLRLAPPGEIERCPRRQFHRISTASLQMPEVVVWPMLDPSSAVPAEIACRAAILDGVHLDQPDELLPDVGPSFKAMLVNISGGGLGLVASRDEASGFEASRYFFLRIDLRPTLAVPLSLTTKLVHRHMDSSQLVHAGMAFDFAFHHEHQAFVAEQVGRCMRVMQERYRAA
jgi:hypothetical protein